MDLDDLDPSAQLFAHEITQALRTLDATHSHSDKRLIALLAALDTLARVRRLLPLMNFDPLHEADIRERLHELRRRVDALTHHDKR